MNNNQDNSQNTNSDTSQSHVISQSSDTNQSHIQSDISQSSETSQSHIQSDVSQSSDTYSDILNSYYNFIYHSPNNSPNHVSPSSFSSSYEISSESSEEEINEDTYENLLENSLINEINNFSNYILNNYDNLETETRSSDNQHSIEYITLVQDFMNNIFTYNILIFDTLNSQDNDQHINKNNITDKQPQEFKDITNIYSTPTECPICSEEYKETSIVFSLDCGHIFHETCMNRWVKIKPTCPLCNKEVPVKTNIVD